VSLQFVLSNVKDDHNIRPLNSLGRILSVTDGVCKPRGVSVSYLCCVDITLHTTPISYRNIP